MTAPVIELARVSHRYGDTEALAPIDLRLTEGATAVLGPNGSGKSTLLRLIATTLAPQTGSVHIDGCDAADPVERTAIRRHLGYATQHDGLPDRMTVAGYLDYVAALKQLAPARRRARWVQWTRGQVGIDDPTQRLGTMSGGYRRRVTLAQALLGAPTLLVADEPLAGLDADSRTTIGRIIADKSVPRSVVVATHHADELATICDRVLVLDCGRLCFDGTPSDLAGQAVGHTWESTEAGSVGATRAIGPGRFRVVSSTPPPGAAPVDRPAVQDGYHAVLARS